MTLLSTTPPRTVARADAVVVAGLRVIRGGRAVLRDVSLELRSGSVTGLLGPSGCGKSTLMRAIVGAQRVAGGTVTVLGEPAGSQALRARVGYMTQAPSIYDDLTVRDNLRYFARVLGVGAARAEEVTGLVRLSDHSGQLVGRLSGGQRARVSLAAALIGDPDLLVLDEPTVGLDPALRRDLWQTFHALAEAGTTLIVSSHVMDEAAHCDSLVLMRDGVVLASGAPSELLERTGAHDLESAFLHIIDGEEARS